MKPTIPLSPDACKYLLGGLLIAAIYGVNARAQSNARPAFEVASVKPNRSGSDNSSLSWNPGSITIANTSLKTLVLHAYGIKGYQLSGGPGWTDTDRFDLSAKSKEGAAPEELRLMLRSLLEDRFRLQVHQETRDLPTFALTVGKNGPKLRAADGNPQTSITKGRLTGQMSMSALADALTRLLDRPVLDMTRIAGRFDLLLEWMPDEDAANGESGRPFLMAAIQEQLGLTLAPQKSAVSILVIDRVEKPTEN